MLKPTPQRSLTLLILLLCLLSPNISARAATFLPLPDLQFTHVFYDQRETQHVRIKHLRTEFSEGFSVIFTLPGAYFPTALQASLRRIKTQIAEFNKRGIRKIGVVTTDNPFSLAFWLKEQGLGSIVVGISDVSRDLLGNLGLLRKPDIGGFQGGRSIILLFNGWIVSRQDEVSDPRVCQIDPASEALRFFDLTFAASDLTVAPFHNPTAIATAPPAITAFDANEFERDILETLEPDQNIPRLTLRGAPGDPFIYGTMPQVIAHFGPIPRLIKVGDSLPMVAFRLIETEASSPMYEPGSGSGSRLESLPEASVEYGPRVSTTPGSRLRSRSGSEVDIRETTVNEEFGVGPSVIFTMPSAFLAGRYRTHSNQLSDWLTFRLEYRDAQLETDPHFEWHLRELVPFLLEFEVRGIKVGLVTADSPYVLAAWLRNHDADHSIVGIADPKRSFLTRAGLLRDDPYLGVTARRAVIYSLNGIVQSVFLEPERTMHFAEVTAPLAILTEIDKINALSRNTNREVATRPTTKRKTEPMLMRSRKKLALPAK